MRTMAALGISLLFVVMSLLPGCGRGKAHDDPAHGCTVNCATSKISFFGPNPAQFNHSLDVEGGVLVPDAIGGDGGKDTVDPGIIPIDF
ncbi:MAG: hypothetical protein ISR64_11010 [Deltaproteobacteria bacterium]|nr:hypothetical protein [Deltaproteobacteria bacterium]